MEKWTLTAGIHLREKLVLDRLSSDELTILVCCSSWSYDDWTGWFKRWSQPGRRVEWFSY